MPLSPRTPHLAASGGTVLRALRDLRDGNGTDGRPEGQGHGLVSEMDLNSHASDAMKERASAPGTTMASHKAGGVTEPGPEYREKCRVGWNAVRGSG